MSTEDNMRSARRPAMAGDEPHSDPRLRVTVVFTSAKATLCALRTAGELARSLEARIAFVAIEVVPLQLPLDQPLVSAGFLEQRLRALVSKAELDADEVSIEILLGRNRRQCLQQLLPPRSVVVIGGKSHWWSRAEAGTMARPPRSSGRFCGCRPRLKGGTTGAIQGSLQEIVYARFDFPGRNYRVLCRGRGLRPFLRSREVRGDAMNLESLVMLAVSILLLVYLTYAMLRPEKF